MIYSNVIFDFFQKNVQLKGRKNKHNKSFLKKYVSSTH